jgi:uncharacterized protein YwgA
MDPRDVVLMVLDAYSGSISGKTLLQKVCYFLDVAYDFDLGFKAHHYGPYAPPIEDAIGELKELGFIREETTGFGVMSSSGFGEVKRYDYRLTNDGKEVVGVLETKMPEQWGKVSHMVKRIRENGDPNYLDLSVAAKSYFILRKQNKPMTDGEIENEAKKLGWQVGSDNIQKAITLLGNLTLVERQKKQLAG